MPYIHSIQMAFPENYYDQKELMQSLSDVWKEHFFNTKRIENIHENVMVKKRHLALKPMEYFDLKGFGDKNNKFIEVALDLSHQAVLSLLNEADLPVSEVSMLMSNSVTGVAIPSLEARLMNLMPFKTNTKRIPIMGLGCLAGVAGINRAMDYLKGHPKEAVVYFSVELCSLTLQLQDISIANIISSGLFGDGAAAVLLVGDEHKLASDSPLKWVNGESTFYPNTEKVMGWDVVDSGLKIILSKDVPTICKEHVPKDTKGFLEKNELTQRDISFFMTHPGGPKVLMAMQEALGITEKDLCHSWNSLEENGNMSSVSVLDITRRTIENLTSKNRNQYGLMAAMGPAFCSELGLFQCKK